VTKDQKEIKDLRDAKVPRGLLAIKDLRDAKGL